MYYGTHAEPPSSGLPAQLDRQFMRGDHDCFRAAMASLLEAPYDETPANEHPETEETPFGWSPREWEEWAFARGIFFRGHEAAHLPVDRDRWMLSLQEDCDDGYTHAHALVMQKDRLYHDPAVYDDSNPVDVVSRQARDRALENWRNGVTHTRTPWASTLSVPGGTTAEVALPPELARLTDPLAGCRRSAGKLGINAQVVATESYVAGFSLTGTHAARPAAGMAGRTYFETDTNVLYRDSGAAWVAVAPGFVSKTADQTLAQSSTTLQNVTELSWPVAASEQWGFDGLLRLNPASVNADWKFGWTVTATTSMTWGIQGAAADFAPGSLSAVPVATAASGLLGLGDSVSVGAIASNHLVRLVGSLSVGATAGTIQFQAAQNTATAENNIIETRSHFRIWRLV